MPNDRNRQFGRHLSFSLGNQRAKSHTVRKKNLASFSSWSYRLPFVQLSGLVEQAALVAIRGKGLGVCRHNHISRINSEIDQSPRSALHGGLDAGIESAEMMLGKAVDGLLIQGRVRSAGDKDFAFHEFDRFDDQDALRLIGQV